MTSEVALKGSKRLKLTVYEETQNERESFASSGCVSENVIVSKTSAVPSEERINSEENRQTEIKIKKEKIISEEPIIIISSDEESEKETCTTDSDLLPNKNIDISEKDKDTNSDIEPIITQEALLAQLGLGSVKKMNSTDNGIDGKLERKPLVDKPKPSIIEMLTVPKISSKTDKKDSSEKKRDAPIVIANGDVDKNSDDNESGDEISKHEAYINKLKEELRGEEAKLLLLRKLYSNQNEVRNNSSKHQKENVGRIQGYPLSSQSEVGKKVYLSTQSTVPAGKLPLPPSSHSGVPIAIAPKSILPKTTPSFQKQGNVVTSSVKSTGLGYIPGSSSKTTSSVQKGGVTSHSHVAATTTAVTLIHHPLPLYPSANLTGMTVTQPSPVRPTAVYVTGGTHIAPSTTYTTQYKPVAVAQAITTTATSASISENTAGRQAAAKLALRKQLEKTLLQIPPPKPPPADWIFIPNLNSTDFTTLLGLEEVVDELARAKDSKDTTTNNAEKAPIKPELCSHCHTDFSPTWLKKSNDNVVCERCQTLTVKKELKAEHTARLKAAFLKALKQEQEIEQKMSENPGIIPKLPSTQHLSASSHLPHHHQLHPQIIHHHPPALYHHHPQPYTEPLFHQLHQRHMQQQQNDLEAARRSADARWHPYLNQHHRSYMSSSDRQREYLLDMIPSVPSTLSYGASRI